MDFLNTHASQWQQLLQLIESRHLPGALGFSGPAGVGKKQIAVAFAQKLVCQNPSPERACGACGPCLRVLNGQSESVLMLEPAGEMYKVDQIQLLKSTLSLQSIGSHRIVILSDAEKLNPQSSNALLKMIEEPPDKTHFILITGSLSALLPTIRSRLFQIRFFKPPGLELAPETSDVVAEAEVALAALQKRDLDSWLEQINAFKEKHKAQHLSKILQLYFRDQVALTIGAARPVLLDLSRKISWSSDVHGLTLNWRKAFEMERALAYNADRTLLFLNYFHEVR